MIISRLEESCEEGSKKWYEERINEGKSIEEIAEEMKVKSITVYTRLSSLGLLRKYRKGLDLRRKVNKSESELIYYISQDKTPTLEQIGSFLGVSRERARQILEDKGLEDIRIFVRIDNEMKLKNVRSRILGQIYKVTHDKAITESERKVLEYVSIRRFYCESHVSFSSLIGFFGRYYESLKNGKKSSLEELSDGLFSIAQASRILKSVGLEPLNGTRSIKYSTSEQKDLVEKIFLIETSLSYRDISKVVGIPFYVLNHRALKKGINKEYKILLSEGSIGGHLTYSKALDFYEAIDAGFSREEAMEYARVNTKRGVDFLFNEREKIEREVRKFKEDVGLI